MKIFVRPATWVAGAICFSATMQLWLPESLTSEPGNVHLASTYGAFSVLLASWLIAAIFAFAGGADRFHKLTAVEAISPRTGLELTVSKLRMPLLAGSVAYLVVSGAALAWAYATGGAGLPDIPGLALGLGGFLLLGCASFAFGRVMGPWLGMPVAVVTSALLSTIAGLDSKLSRLFVAPVFFNTDVTMVTRPLSALGVLVMALALALAAIIAAEVVRGSWHPRRNILIGVLAGAAMCATVSAAAVVLGPSNVVERPVPAAACSDTVPRVCVWPDHQWVIDAAPAALELLGEQPAGSLWAPERYVQDRLAHTEKDQVFQPPLMTTPKALAQSLIMSVTNGSGECLSRVPQNPLPLDYAVAFMMLRSGMADAVGPPGSALQDESTRRVESQDLDWLAEQSERARQCLSS